MKFAVNYSPLLAEMVQEGSLQIDRFKCPAWPDLLVEAQKAGPVYIHFPLSIGNGLGGPLDEEKKTLAYLDYLAELFETTGTPLVNTHFTPLAKNYPGLPTDTRDPRHIRQVLDGALRDLEPLLKRFGPERVTIENIINEFGWLSLATDPDVFARLLDESGCGFLFDLSHARLAARGQGLDERAYIRQLPLDRAREIHVTGLGVLEGPLLEHMVAIGDPYSMAKYLAGKWMDHLPMTDADWAELEWLLGLIKTGNGQAPWVIAYEFGGVGKFWEDVINREIYLDQIPRMGAMIHAVSLFNQ